MLHPILAFGETGDEGPAPKRNPVILPLIAWIATLLFAGPGLYQATQFDISGQTANEWIGLLVWGMGPLAVGTLVWLHGLSQVQASTASGYMSAMPATALILSYVWVGDAFHPIHLVGFALVFVSIGLVTWAHRIKEKSEQKGESAAESRSGAMPC
jgi:drug/metabolite transporter (DMT)-like permease